MRATRALTRCAPHYRIFPRSRRGSEADHSELQRPTSFHGGCPTDFGVRREAQRHAALVNASRASGGVNRRGAETQSILPGCFFTPMRCHRTVRHRDRFRKRCRHSALPPHSTIARWRSITNLPAVISSAFSLLCVSASLRLIPDFGLRLHTGSAWQSVSGFVCCCCRGGRR